VSEIELLMIGFTMILATGMVRCLEGIYHGMTSPQRYWIPQVLLWSTFIYGFNFLWGFKNNLSDPSPVYSFYASSIIAASAFFMRAHILATKDAGQVEDWPRHFQDSARPFFIASILGTSSTIMILRSTGESTGFDAVSVPFWLGIGLNSIGAIFEKTWVRGAVAIMLLILVILASYILFTNDLI
jgi:hypothetical protein